MDINFRLQGASLNFLQKSDLGQEPTSRHVGVMSVIPLKADIHQRSLHVRLVPETDIQGESLAAITDLRM
jgi:hypothetical protein